MEAAAIAARWTQYLLLTALFGLAAFGLYARPAADALRLGRAQAILAALALVGSALALAIQGGQMTGESSSGADPALLWTVASETRSGHAWLVQVAALAILASIPPGRLAVALAALALWTLAWRGHGAMTDGAPGLAHLAADALHLTAAGLWIGALLAFAALALRLPRDLEAVQAALRRFSGLGSGLVAVLILTGLANTAFLADWRHPLTAAATGWGRLLGVKLGLFAAMLALAAVNRFRLTARLSAGGDAVGRLRASVLAEASLGIAVLGLVAWLGTLAPDGGG